MGHGVSDLAEDLPVGSRCRWDDYPRVVPEFGMLRFPAPSMEGQVVRVAAGRAFVRFEIELASGATRYSDPLEVLPGQACTVVRRGP